MQHAQMLREMATVPRCLGRAPVPNPHYFGADNVAQRGRRLSHAELLAAALVGWDPSAKSARYDMSDMGEIQSYLGICIVQDWAERCIQIDQSGYIADVLMHFGMANANSHNMPLPSGADVHLVKYTGQASLSDIKHYQSLIGSLLYIQIGTRPDVAFVVSHLATDSV